MIKDYSNLCSLLIQHVNSNEEKWKGYLYACALFAFNITGTLSFELHCQKMLITGMRVRGAVVGAIYEKALLISNAARKGEFRTFLIAVL